MAKEYYITTCTNYNGHLNVLFMMEASDVEWRNAIADKGGQEELFAIEDKTQYILGERVRTITGYVASSPDDYRRYRIATTESKQYKVFIDHSMKEIT